MLHNYCAQYFNNNNISKIWIMVYEETNSKLFNYMLIFVVMNSKMLNELLSIKITCCK